MALDVYQWLCCNGVKGQGRFSADHKDLYDSYFRVTANNLVGKNHPHLFHLSAEGIQKSLRENMAGEYMELNSR